jgi:heterodisulfide reductase subunit B
MQTYSYYPGCSLHGTAKEYDHSLKLVTGKLGIQLHEIPGWNCCGATAAHSTDEILGLALPARNLILAAARNQPLLAPCAMCFNRTKVTQHELRNAATRKAVEERLDGVDLEATGASRLEVLSLLQALASDEMRATAARWVVKPLEGLKVVCYYGCLLVRPAEVMHPDSLENPQTMDQLMQAMGAEVLDWPFKTECCGASLAIARSDVVLALGRRLLSMARGVGADAIVTACPMCHSNLDTRQVQIKARYGESFDMPIFYVTELMGLAFGFTPRQLSLHMHVTNATRLAERIGRQPVTAQG